MREGEPNVIKASNYKKMWCRHTLVLDWTNSTCGAAVNRNGNCPNPKCVGLSCPALKIIAKENDNDWIGYCGANHK